MLFRSVLPAAAPSSRRKSFASASATSRFSRRSPPGYYDGEPTNGRFRRANTVAEPRARRKSSRRGISIPFSISRHLLLPVQAATVRRSDQTSSRRGSRITIPNATCRPAQGSIHLRVGPGIGLRQSVRVTAVRVVQERKAVCAQGLQGQDPAVLLCYGSSSGPPT